MKANCGLSSCITQKLSQSISNYFGPRKIWKHLPNCNKTEQRLLYKKVGISFSPCHLSLPFCKYFIGYIYIVYQVNTPYYNCARHCVLLFLMPGMYRGRGFKSNFFPNPWAGSECLTCPDHIRKEQERSKSIPGISRYTPKHQQRDNPV